MALIGANPGIDDDEERRRRRASDDLLASRLAEIGVDAFLAEWMAQPLFGRSAPDDADVADRARNSVDGLTGSLRLAGTGAQVSVWNRLRELSMPVLALAGERDTKFTVIGRQLAAGVRDGTFASVADADHAAHLGRPEAVVALLAAWLKR
jgi:2-succinyl-6-hydroxy-2,4-cyclohexadiene-1-carboxylate synthase